MPELAVIHSDKVSSVKEKSCSWERPDRVKAVPDVSSRL